MIVLALAWAGGCAVAQQPQAVETELEPVTVSANAGAAVAYDRTGVSVEVMDADELRSRGITTLNEALATVPGVYVQPGGGDNQRGNITGICMRGFKGNGTVLTMVDGMRTSSLSAGLDITGNTMARAHAYDLGNIEVLRGSQGAMYGNGAQAGVIFMETPEGTADKPHVRLTNEAGSFDTYTGNAVFQGRQGKLSYYLSGTYEHTNNDLKYLDGSRPQTKHAARYQNYSEAVRLDYHANDTNTVTATYRREDAEYNYSSAAYGQTPYDFRSNLATLRWDSKLTDKYSSRVMAGYYGADYMLGHGYYYNLRNVQTEWRNAYKWNDKNTTAATFGWLRSQFGVKYGSDRQPNEGNLDNTYSAALSHAYSPAQNWDTNISLRLDHSTVFNNLYTMRADSSYRFNGDKSRITASVGRGYRAPGSFARSNAEYVDPLWGSTYRGNPNLSCETSWSADLGFEQTIAENHTAGVTLFWQRKEKALATAYLEDWSATTVNARGHWTAQGVELTLRGTLEKGWNTGYSLGYTYTRPLQQDHKQAPCSARQVWSADIHTSPTEKFTTGFGLAAAVGRSGFGTAYQPYMNDNYYTLRWYARYTVNEHLSLNLRVENLTNQRFVAESAYTVYDAAAYGQSILSPGTAVYAGCEVSF